MTSKLLIIPNAQEVKRIIESTEEIVASSESTNYWNALDEMLNARSVMNFVTQNSIDPILYKLSAGTSTLTAPNLFVEALSISLQQNSYQAYAPSPGSENARTAAAMYENLRTQNNKVFEVGDVVLTTGSTGAISGVIEAISRNTNGRIVIAAPTYYLYRYCAQYYNVSFREVSAIARTNGEKTSFLCADEIVSSIDSSTSLVCIVSPTNPTGEIYSQKAITDILRKAKEYGAIVLIDELFLDPLSSGSETSPSQIAFDLGCLDNLIIVNGMSKNINLAGLRIGYAITKNKNLTKQLMHINQIRCCFPVGYQSETAIVLYFYLRCIQLSSTSQSRINVIKDTFQSIGLQFRSNQLNSYLDSMCKVAEHFLRIRSKSIALLGSRVLSRVDTKMGFNTFVKLKGFEQVNQFDFTVSCYLSTGVRIETGPCYGLGQKKWECDPMYGFWVRLSTARDECVYLTAIEKFCDFIDWYERSGALPFVTNKRFS